ncbi:GNAT family N-acetyltransferase [Dactylosporangium sp. NPDC051485]|uniref:GNAT family N-acetyltransferase n=1 Tax=Dactylosporangium sp. NPDC051485 TaxID=3154846 RepID=UPI0034123F8E
MARTPIKIVEVRADDPAAIDVTYDIGDAALRADVPDWPDGGRFSHAALFRVPAPWCERRVFLALDGDAPAGTVELELPLRDNLSNAHIEVLVAPGHRRRGIGRALYRHAAELARAAGRTTAHSFSLLAPAQEAFCAGLAMRNGLTDARRRLLIADLDHAALDRLHAGGLARADGYTVVRWVGEAPEEYLEDLAALDSSFVAEAPMGELEYEPEKVDVGRIREQQRTFAARGSRRYHTGVVHAAGGRLVAWTAMGLSEGVDWHAWQGITLVRPEHRGHRLGIVAKVENLRAMLAAEPAVTTIDTFNAASNEHMIAINEAMGFRFAGNWANWQGPTTL